MKISLNIKITGGYKLILLASVLFLCSCAAVSLHRERPVNVTVTKAISNEPVAQASIHTQYDYDSYGMFYFARRPIERLATTNNDGKAIIEMSNYRYGIIIMVNGEFYQATAQDVDTGALLQCGPRNSYNVNIKPIPK